MLCFLRNARPDVPELAGVETLLVTQVFGCAELIDGRLTCWGSDDHGVISDAPDGITFEGVTSRSESFACGIVRDGVGVTCWGAVPDWLDWRNVGVSSP